MSIYKKLLLAFMLLSIIPLLIYTIISNVIFLGETRDFVREYSDVQLSSINSQVVALLDTAENEVQTLSENILLKYESDDDFTNFIGADPDTFEYNITSEEQDIIDLFNSYRMNHSYMNSVYFGTVNGAFVRSHERARSTDYDPRLRVWYQLGEDNPDEVQLTDPYMSVTTNDINLGTVKAVFSDQGDLLGVVGADITLYKLSEITTEFEGYDHSYNVIISDKNIILSHPNPEYLFQDASVLENSFPKEVSSEDSLFKFDEQGMSKSVYTYYSEETGWYFYRVVPMSVLNQNVKELVIYSVLLVTALVLIMFLFNTRVSKFFSNRIRVISNAMEMVGAKKQLVQVDDKWNDELSIISAEFNKMMKRVDEAQYKIEFLDNDTGLPNITQLKKILNMRSRGGYLIQVSITNLLLLNQIYGIDQTNKLVLQITSLLQSITDDESVLGRSSTSDFIYLFRNINEKDVITEKVKSLHKVLSQKFYIDDLQVYLKYKIGGISLIGDNSSSSELIVNLNLTTMAHNLLESDFQLFDIEKKESILIDLKIQKEMFQALERNEFFTMFQPIINMTNNKIIGYEVLARWENNELGLVRPDVFIPIAEKNRIIIGLGQTVLIQALEFASDYKRINKKPIMIAVNCSVIQLMYDDMYQLIKKLLKEYDFDAKYLTLEVTETVFYDGVAEISNILLDIKKLGVRIALDDFGSGFSTITNLMLLPLDFVKIDKSLFWYSLDDEKGSVMVKTILDYATKTGIEVIVEGVETKEMEEKVIEFSAKYTQGYLYSHPQRKSNIFKESE